ncbi:MAG TPA: gamma-glutamyltransferase [Solirubrobacteraceae bacterium]|nr:gamma-glutamyltransferase [Solirubrobacteraceae bacterium]
MRGVVAAGHPVTAEAGAEALRAGGNAVDAALAAMFTSFVAEPMLTGLGAGGYMLVAPPGEEPVLLDFFVEAPGRGLAPGAPHAPLRGIDVDFGDAVQVFNIGAAAAGPYGTVAGAATAAERFGRLPLAELVAPAAATARRGVTVNEQQAYLFQILRPITDATPEARALFMPAGRSPQVGDVHRDPELAVALERLGAEGPAPFYTGDIAAAVCGWIADRGGLLTRADLAAYATVARAPVRVAYRGQTVVTNPPPSAGGILLAYVLAQLDRGLSPPPVAAVVDAMEAAQAERTPDFLVGLHDPGFLERFTASRLGATTHISVADADGWACAVTCTNGEGCGEVVPGTGIHLNNMMGEQDLSPFGFFSHPPGRRLPSMMAPTMVLGAGVDPPRLVLGSAGSNRIRSAILQVVIGVLDQGLGVQDAIDAPRVHFEDEIAYVEPGLDTAGLESDQRTLVRFSSRNLFFGGAQAVQRDLRTGKLSGGGDPRRGGAVAEA